MSVDWNWLFVVGEIGCTYLFYHLWRNKHSFVTFLEVAPHVNIDDLKNIPAKENSIDYAVICGVIKPTDSKSAIKSRFISGCKGVIQNITLTERRMEKYRSIWTEVDKSIHSVTNFVPFCLETARGNSVRIEKPLEFHRIEDALEAIHIEFEANRSSATQRIVDTIVGSVPKGVQTTEKMLKLDIPLTGVGQLKRKGNVWYLQPHPKWGGILSTEPHENILSDHRSLSKTFRFLFIACSIATIATASWFIWKLYSERRAQHPPNGNRTPPAPSVAANIDNHETREVHHECVICLENEIIYCLQPCSHLGLCETCSQRLRRDNPARQICPICRVPIQQYQRIYLS